MLAAKAGAIESLVAVMRAHIGGDAGVLEKTCQAMARICEDNGAWSWRRGEQHNSARTTSLESPQTLTTRLSSLLLL